MTQDEALQKYTELCTLNQEKYGKSPYQRRGNRWTPESDVPLEHHHIVPDGLGGTDSPENMVWFTFEEHLYAHELLTFVYPKSTGLKAQFSTMKNETEESRAEKCRKAGEASRSRGAGAFHDPKIQKESKELLAARRERNKDLLESIYALWASLDRAVAETVLQYKPHRGIKWIQTQKTEILEYYFQELTKLTPS